MTSLKRSLPLQVKPHCNTPWQACFFDIDHLPNIMSSCINLQIAPAVHKSALKLQVLRSRMLFLYHNHKHQKANVSLQPQHTIVNRLLEMDVTSTTQIVSHITVGPIQKNKAAESVHVLDLDMHYHIHCSRLQFDHQI